MKLAAALAFALVLGTTACGGSSSSSGDSSTSTSTTTTGMMGGNGTGKLTAAQWSTLQGEIAKAQTVNQQGIAAFKACRVKIKGNYSDQVIATCFTDATTPVVQGGKQLNAALAAAQQQAGPGACNAALGTTLANVHLYISSVNQLGLTAKSGTVPQSDDVDTTLAQLTKAQTSAKGIEPGCKPA
jgi:hypothetical protein